MKNINTSEYWDRRFSSGDWEEKKGRKQTADFAKEQVVRLGLPNTFSGTILDFGCGLGDAMRVYRKAFPQAKLIGLDHSREGIEKCRQQYSQFAIFIHGGIEDVPSVDVIISSNVFEHLTDDLDMADNLIKRCKKLFIVVPYNETILSKDQNEHVNSYNEWSFHSLPCLRKVIFESVGLGKKKWWKILYHVWFKNFFRFVVRGKVWTYIPPKEIMFEFQGKL